MSTSDESSTDSSTPTSHRIIDLNDGVIAPEALDALALAAAEVGADHIRMTRHRHLEVHGIVEHRVAEFDSRVRAAGLASAETPTSEPAADVVEAPPRVGWADRADRLVVLGAVTERSRMSPEQARYVAAIGIPVRFTARREVVLDGLTEAVAETVVRVLAPIGFIFDASFVAE